MKNLFCLSLTLLTLFLNAYQPMGAEWLEKTPDPRFVFLSADALTESIEKGRSYFCARGVGSDEEIARWINEDFLHIEQALSLLFSWDPKEVLQGFLGDRFFLVENTNFQIDHLGRELYGPLSLYLEWLEKSASKAGFACVKKQVFPSTQVVKVLREQDPDLSGVTIARIYLQNLADGVVKCIELFQPALPDESFPQPIGATQKRLSLLGALQSDELFSPIDHLAIRLSSIEEIQAVQNRIQELASDTLLPYQKEISFNPGDRSANTKVMLRRSTQVPFNQIVEFVHYEQN